MVKTAAGDDMVPTPSNAMKNDIYIYVKVTSGSLTPWVHILLYCNLYAVAYHNVVSLPASLTLAHHKLDVLTTG